jgi:hypothetical protein
MKEIDTALQNSCGIQTTRYAGALGHIYYANDLAGIIAQVLFLPLPLQIIYLTCDYRSSAIQLFVNIFGFSPKIRVGVSLKPIKRIVGFMKLIPIKPVRWYASTDKTTLFMSPPSFLVNALAFLIDGFNDAIEFLPRPGQCMLYPTRRVG